MTALLTQILSSGLQQAEQVLVVDGFLAVGEFGEAVVDLVELRAGERVAEFDEALFEGAAAAVFAEDEELLAERRRTRAS